MALPKNNLSTLSQPWARAVEKLIVNTQSTLSKNEINNVARDAQLAASYRRLDITATNAATAAAEANAAILGLTSLGSVDSDYTINAGNINAGTLTGITVQSALSGKRVAMNSDRFLIYDTLGNVRGRLEGTETAGMFRLATTTTTNEYSYASTTYSTIEMLPGTIYLGARSGTFYNGPVTIQNGQVTAFQFTGTLSGAVYSSYAEFTGGNLPASWQGSGKAYISEGSIRATNGGVVLALSRASTTGAIAAFQYSTTTIGSISVTTSSTAYNTTSDYRLKENVVPMTSALARLNSLKPSRFNFIADPDKTVDGFIAHEVQAVVPEAIHGEKDAVDEDGNPEYQGIDQSKLVPLLVGALQELSAKVEVLESK